MEQQLLPVEVMAILDDPRFGAPVIVLQNRESKKVLPMVIGEPEAQAISIALRRIEPVRPLTHDLLLHTILGLEGRMEKVIVRQLEGNAYYAYICIILKDRIIQIDCRPSDAIAIAVRARVPIFVREELMKEIDEENLFDEGISPHQQRPLSEEELKKLEKLLKEAQEREQMG